jgi:hypothetical protein
MEASMTFDVPDPDFEPRIRKSFSRRNSMTGSAQSLDA